MSSLLSMMKTTVLLNIFVETMMHVLQESFMNRKFKAKAFILNRKYIYFLFYYFYFLLNNDQFCFLLNILNPEHPDLLKLS